MAGTIISCASRTKTKSWRFPQDKLRAPTWEPTVLDLEDIAHRALTIALDALARALKSIRERKAAGQDCSDSDVLDQAITDLQKRWREVKDEQYGGDRDEELRQIQDAIAVLERMRR